MKRSGLALRQVIAGFVAGTALGALAGFAANLLLSSMDAHIDYVMLPKGNPLLSAARIFAGNLLLVLLVHYLPERLPRHPELPALLIGAVGFVLGFFAVTSGIPQAEYLRRLPHTVLEVFAYVVAARGGRLWPAVAAVAAGAVLEPLLVLR